MEEKENSERKSNESKDNNERKKPDCTLYTFPWLVGISVVRLLIYLYKIYEDSSAVYKYYNAGHELFCFISAACLFTPAIAYALYLVFSYLNKHVEIKNAEIGTKMVYGMLLIPWQIKSLVEILHFSVQRVCQKRSRSEEEKSQYTIMHHQAAVLEFFEAFFAGFLQLVLQIYIIIMSKEYFYFNYYPLVGELIASSLVLGGMVTAVKRKDDGYLTTFLSFVGWTLVIASRCTVMALAASIIYGGIFIFCVLHAVFVTLWLTPICWKSYSETELSKHKKTATVFLIFILFGLPSLIYWPILFQLKQKKRPIIFMLILTLENVALFCIWFFLRENKQWTIHMTIYTVILCVGTVFGFLFILFYICIKPKYTDQVVLHDMKIENGESFGMYFDFCNITFQLPFSEFVETNLQHIRQMEIS